MTEPVIRPWTAADHDVVVPMILDCIAVNQEAGSDVVPTLPNAERFWRMGLHWAAQGDPSLLFVLEGETLGYTCWGGFPDDFERDVAVCWGNGTYVRPDVRRQGVASQLRRAAARVAERRGYGKVIGTAFHEAGERSMAAVGFTRTARQMEWALC